jgi:uncharacterized protein YjdB
MKIKSVLSCCLVLFTILTIIVSAVGCSSGTSTAKTLSSIAVSSDTTGNLGVGVTRQLIATGSYADGTTANISGQVSWKSSNSSIAKISSDGLISGVAAGTTDITASKSGITSQSLHLSVVVRNLQSIEISPSSPPELAVDAYSQFTVIGKYDDGSTSDLTQKVTWASSDSNIASITNDTGLAKGKAAGTTNITATIASLTAQPVKLTVAQDVLSNITITPAALDTLPVESTQQFEALGYYSNSSTDSLTSSVTWTSSDTGVATVSTTGLVTAVATGIAKITASMSGVTSDVVIVPVAVLQSIAITPAEPLTLAVGSTQRFVALATYSDGAVAVITSKVTWTSSETSIASIAASGVASGIADGNTNISATFAGISSPTVNLKVAKLVSLAITPAPSFEITVSATQQFIVKATYSDNTTADITASATWSSSDTKIATVSSTGLATGVAAGTATITAKFVDVVSPEVTLTVK